MSTTEASARRGVPQRASMIDVAITFCNGVVFVHNHESMREAAMDYAERLIDAVEPPDVDMMRTPLLDENWPAPHVRQIAMVFYDDQNQHMRMIDSGVFPCEHQA